MNTRSGQNTDHRWWAVLLATALSGTALLGWPGVAAAGELDPVPGVAPQSATSGGRSVSIDGDADDDLLHRDNATGELTVQVSSGQPAEGGPFVSSQVVGRGWDRYRWFGAGDFNHDDFGDVAAVSPDGTLSIMLNRGKLDGLNTFAPPVVVGTGLQHADLIFTGDADGDGLDDIQARRRGTTITYTRHNNDGATPSFAPARELLRTASGVVDQKMADVTLDHRLDVVSVKNNGDTHVRDLGTGRSYYLGPLLRNVKRSIVGDFYRTGAPNIITTTVYSGGGSFSVLMLHADTFDPNRPAASYSGGGDAEIGTYDARDDFS